MRFIFADVATSNMISMLFFVLYIFSKAIVATCKEEKCKPKFYVLNSFKVAFIINRQTIHFTERNSIGQYAEELTSKIYAIFMVKGKQHIKQGIEWGKNAVRLMNPSRNLLYSFILQNILLLLLECVDLFLPNVQVSFTLTRAQSNRWSGKVKITSIDWMPKHNHRWFVYTLKQKLACKWSLWNGKQEKVIRFVLRSNLHRQFCLYIESRS